MAVWQITIYEKKNDASPSRRGFTEADTENDAAQVAADHMGDSERADIHRTVLRGGPVLKPGEIVWS